MLTVKRLREVLSYDPLTGTFTWLVTLSRNVKTGRVAGVLHSRGYVHIQIDKKVYKAHRLAWLYMTGEWPKDQLDHRDKVRSNNVFLNLREATNAQNHQNKDDTKAIGKSGRRGVSKTPSGKFQATITINGKKLYMGLFPTPDEAHQRYLEAKKELHPFGDMS